MAFFTAETIERVREAADIVEVVSAHTDLRRQGQQYVGLCPFHDERTPSFSVDAVKKVYYCFGCEAGGDIIGFVREKENLDFQGAVEQLADRFGIPLEYEQADADSERRRQARERLLELLAQAAGYYERYLWESAEAKRARAYLNERGLSDDTLHRFRVGYAPSAWDRMLTRALETGYTREELADAGLAATGRGGGAYDRFRGRIMFPLSDSRGRARGFGARAARAGQQPKYVNSPDGPVYHKGRHLFGLDVAKQAIAKASQAIVVEGYTDVLALHQAGIENAVAIMGTALTQEQIGELARLASTLTLALDADRSGQEAMLRALEVARDRSLELKVVRLPDDKDPCEIVLQDGAQAFRKRIEEAVPLLQFQVDTILDSAELGSAAGKDRALAALAPVFARVGQSVQKEEQIRRVASRLDVPDHLLGRLRTAQDAVSTTAQAAPPATVSRAEEAERTFVAMCMAAGEPGREQLKRLTGDHLSSDLVRRAVDHLRQNAEQPLESVDPSDAELVGILSELAFRSGEVPVSEQALEVEFLRLERGRLERELAVAIESGNDTRQLERERAAIVEGIGEAMAKTG